MSKFPVDAPIREVVKALERLGFELLREGNHIAMTRENPDGTRSPFLVAAVWSSLRILPKDSGFLSRSSNGRHGPILQ